MNLTYHALAALAGTVGWVLLAALALLGALALIVAAQDILWNRWRAGCWGDDVLAFALAFASGAFFFAAADAAGHHRPWGEPIILSIAAALLYWLAPVVGRRP